MTEKNEEKKKGVTVKVPKINPWIITTIVLLVILAVVLASGWSITGKAISDGTTVTISASEAGNKAIDYINKYVLQGQATATLEGINEKNGLYNAKLNIAGRIYDSYITMDGKLLFPSAVDLTETPEITTTAPETLEVPKTDKPEAHVFIMSYCPYGIQFLTAYTPVMELLGDKANLQVNFVNYIMHGEKEMLENNRMYCIQKEQNEKFTKYLSCFVNDQDWEKCYQQAGIDKAKIDSCIQEIDKEFKITETYNQNAGGGLPKYLVDDELVKEFKLEADGSFGSPTFVLNGVEIPVTRTPEGIKQAVCSAFNNPPTECSQTLSASGTQASGSCS